MKQRIKLGQYDFLDPEWAYVSAEGKLVTLTYPHMYSTLQQMYNVLSYTVN